MQFGSLAAPSNPAAPAVPADGAMQPTIGPGTPSPAANPSLKLGLPTGGLLAMMRGQSNPQGLVGLLQQLSAGQGGAPGSALTGVPAGAGMLGAALGSSQPSSIGGGLPLDIKPMDLF